MAHFKKSHGTLSHDQISLLVESGRTAPASYRLADCPFCDWAAERRRRRPGDPGLSPGLHENETVKPFEFKRHVASHQEQLALFVIPRSQLIGDDDSDGGGSEIEAPREDVQSDSKQHSQHEETPSKVAAFTTPSREDELAEKMGRVDISQSLENKAPPKAQTEEDSLETKEEPRQSAKKDDGDTAASAVEDEHSSTLHSERGASNLGTERANDQQKVHGGRRHRLTVWFCVGA